MGRGGEHEILFTILRRTLCFVSSKIYIFIWCSYNVWSLSFMSYRMQIHWWKRQEAECLVGRLSDIFTGMRPLMFILNLPAPGHGYHIFEYQIDPFCCNANSRYMVNINI